MSYIYLKKYVLEQQEYNVLELNNRNMEEYKFNYKEKIQSKNTALQKIYVLSDFNRTKVKADYITLDTILKKSYLDRLLSYLPPYMRKDSYIISIFSGYEGELLLIDSEEQKLENDLNIYTAISKITTYEDDYRVENKIEYGTYFRRNTIIAKRIAKYLNWNLESVNIYSNLFFLGNIKEVINDKKNFKQTIVINGSVSNNEYLNEFKKFVDEIGPAYYEFEIRGEQ